MDKTEQTEIKKVIKEKATRRKLQKYNYLKKNKNLKETRRSRDQMQ